MDPLSTTVGVAKISSQCISTAIYVHDVWVDCGDAPQSAAELVDELIVARASLLQLQKIFERDDGAAAITTDLEDVFDIAVKGSKATLLCIEQEYKDVADQPNWWLQAEQLWKKDTMTDLMDQLARKETSIALLIQCLNE